MRLFYTGRGLRRMAAAVVAAPLAMLAATTSAAAPLPPSQDPFYSQPSPMPAVAPGNIVATRSVGLVLPVAARAWQLKYATTDPHDQPVVAIATLIVPTTPVSGARPLLSYNFAIDSNSLDCNPSYALQGGLTTSEGNSNNSVQELPLVQMALSAGWAVVVPDHEGLAMNWTVGPMSGHAVLDGLRAARNFSQAGLGNSPIGMWGYSGGAQATMWAAELAPSYAPELRFSGIAAGGVPVDLISIAHKADGSSLAGIELAAIIGQIDGYPEYGVQNWLNAQGQQLRQDVRKQCLPQSINQYGNARIADYVTVPDPLGQPQAQQITAHSRLGQQRPAGPLYIYQGVWDELIPYVDVTGIVNGYCAQGVPVTYNLDQLQLTQDHFLYAGLGAPGAFTFLQSAFAGSPLPSTCGLPQQPAPPPGSVPGY